MKNKVIIGIVLLLLVINGAMSGYLITKAVALDKRTEEIRTVVDNNFAGVDNNFDELSESIGGIRNAFEGVELQILFLAGAIDSLNKTVTGKSSGLIETDEAIGVEIWIDEKNVIHRTGVSENVDSLSWEIIYNGERVLSRNALNETEYKYFKSEPGTYTIYMMSYIDGSYKVVSNVESYTIE